MTRKTLIHHLTGHYLCEKKSHKALGLSGVKPPLYPTHDRLSRRSSLGPGPRKLAAVDAQLACGKRPASSARRG